MQNSVNFWVLVSIYKLPNLLIRVYSEALQKRGFIKVSEKDTAFEINGFSSIDKWDFENSFYWFSDPTRINKLLAQYELYKSIIDLPGDVLEFGVYKLCSLIRLATYRNLIENDFSRK